MPDCSLVTGRKWLKGFAILSMILAASAGALGLLMGVALKEERAFQVLLEAVAESYSRNGTISPEGVEIIKRVATVLMWGSGALAVGSGVFAGLLRRALRPTEVGASAIPPIGQESRPEESWLRPKGWAVVALGFLAIGVALRAPRLSTSLFYDEIFTIQNFATLSFLNIPFVQLGANNHVLNSLLLHLILLVSSNEAILRLPVYLAGIGSLWLFFCAGRDLAGSLVGLFALWLAVMSPYHLLYSTLARGYMLGLFFQLAGLCIFLRAPKPTDWWPPLAFGVTQALAIWAMPTLAVVPVLLAWFILLGSISKCRSAIGIDPWSPSGLAWLLAALWVITIMGAIYLPVFPYFVLQAAGPVATGAQTRELLAVAAADWFGVFEQGPMGLVIGLSILSLGMAVLWRKWNAANWKLRFLLCLWTASAVLFFLKPYPTRIHVVLLIGTIVLAAVGIRAVVVTAVFRKIPPSARAWVGGVLSLAFVVGITLTSWGQMVEAARGFPLQDIRGATRLAESALKENAMIVTSGFAGREVKYYATGPVLAIPFTVDPSTLLTSVRTFCYFRLYELMEADPIFDYFRRAKTPGLVVKGREPISLWCFQEGRPFQLTTP